MQIYFRTSTILWPQIIERLIRGPIGHILTYLSVLFAISIAVFGFNYNQSKTKIGMETFHAFDDFRFALNPALKKMTENTFICKEGCHEMELVEEILKTLPPLLKERLRPHILVTLRMATKYQVDPLWAISVMWTESHFNINSISPVGAYGLMQIMPQTAQHLTPQMLRESKLIDGLGTDRIFDAIYRDLFRNPHFNIEMGIFYLKYLDKFFASDKKLATLAYNAGPYKVRELVKSNKIATYQNDYFLKVSNVYRNLFLTLSLTRLKNV